MATILERHTQLPYNTGVIIGNLMFPAGMGCIKCASCFECTEPDCTAKKGELRNNGRRVTLDRVDTIREYCFIL